MKLLTLLSLSATALAYCGDGWEYEYTMALPEGTYWDSRNAELYVYGNGEGDGCLVMINNEGPDQHMTLSVCNYEGEDCDVDSGVFSQYAGPVYVSSFACAEVTASMGPDGYSTYFDFESMYVFPCD